MPRSHRWGELTSAELAEAATSGAVPVLPAGSVEQHGAHLPLDTDLAAVEAVVHAAAGRCADPFVLVLPALPFGFAPEHAAWPGTVTLSLATFAAVVADIAGSVARAGFARLLVVNGHGGNSAALAAAAAEATGIDLAVIDYWAAGQPEWSPLLPGARRTMGHACAYETALAAALRPAEAARIRDRSAGLPPRLDRPAEVAGGPVRFPPDRPGYYGDPAAAAAADAGALFEATVDGLVRAFVRLGPS